MKKIKLVGILLFIAFLPMIDDRQKRYKKLKWLAYKAIDACLITGNELVLGLAVSEFEKDFRHWLQQPAEYQTRHPIIFRVDGSKTGHHYGREIPELQKLFDYVNHHNIKTHEIYVLLGSIGKKEYVLGFYLKHFSGDEGCHDIAKKLFNEFFKQLPDDLVKLTKHYAGVALDGAWGHGSMMKWLKVNEFRHVAVKSGGKDGATDKNGKMYKNLKKFKDERIKQLENGELSWHTFNDCHHLSGLLFHMEELHLSKSDCTVQIVLIKFIPKRSGQKPRYLMLLTLHEDGWHAFRVVKLYRGRWPIETMFRTSKQRFDLEKYSFHAKRIKGEPTPEKVKSHDKQKAKALARIEKHVGLRLIGYMILNWYRVTHTRPSKTPLRKVIVDWKDFFAELSPKAFQNLFARKKRLKKRRIKFRRVET